MSQRPPAERRAALEPRDRQPRRRARTPSRCASRTSGRTGRPRETRTRRRWRRGVEAVQPAARGPRRLVRLREDREALGRLPLGGVRGPERPAQLRRQLHPDVPVSGILSFTFSGGMDDETLENPGLLHRHRFRRDRPQAQAREAAVHAQRRRSATASRASAWPWSRRTAPGLSCPRLRSRRRRPAGDPARRPDVPLPRHCGRRSRRGARRDRADRRGDRPARLHGRHQQLHVLVRDVRLPGSRMRSRTSASRPDTSRGSTSTSNRRAERRRSP